MHLKEKALLFQLTLFLCHPFAKIVSVVLYFVYKEVTLKRLCCKFALAGCRLPVFSTKLSKNLESSDEK